MFNLVTYKSCQQRININKFISHKVGLIKIESKTTDTLHFQVKTGIISTNN